MRKLAKSENQKISCISPKKVLPHLRITTDQAAK